MSRDTVRSLLRSKSKIKRRVTRSIGAIVRQNPFRKEVSCLEEPQPLPVRPTYFRCRPTIALEAITPPPLMPLPLPRYQTHPYRELEPFNLTPHRHMRESRSSYHLRCSRLRVANRVWLRDPKAPLLRRVDPRNGSILRSYIGFSGTRYNGGWGRPNPNRWKVKRPQGLPRSMDIGEDVAGEERAERKRADRLARRKGRALRRFAGDSEAWDRLDQASKRRWVKKRRMVGLDLCGY